MQTYISNHAYRTEAGNRLEKKQSCGLFSAKGCGKSSAGRLFIVCYILSQILGQYWAPPPPLQRIYKTKKPKLQTIASLDSVAYICSFSWPSPLSIVYDRLHFSFVGCIVYLKQMYSNMTKDWKKFTLVLARTWTKATNLWKIPKRRVWRSSVGGHLEAVSASCTLEGPLNWDKSSEKTKRGSEKWFKKNKEVKNIDTQGTNIVKNEGSKEWHANAAESFGSPFSSKAEKWFGFFVICLTTPSVFVWSRYYSAKIRQG